ncbi:MAG TPA: LysR substrate-binding domain-containing protein [Devosiaceae bacterium]
MKALIAFESVVRLGSVTSAADELFVTHGAISKQIATLEDWFGRPLFHKNRKHMQPTDEAMTLAEATDRAWEMIAETVAELRRDADATILKVIAPSTFAMRWLIPRVWSFSEEHAQISVQVRQTDSLDAWLDIPFDVAIRSDPHAPDHLTTTPFLREKLILAISPRLLLAGKLASPADLPAGSILRAATRPGELEAWLKAAGMSQAPRKAASFPHFYLALEAALAGMGALVCPLETIGDLLFKGELIEPWPHIRVDGPTYAALYDANSPQVQPARTFVTWLSLARRSGAAVSVPVNQRGEEVRIRD